MMLHGLGDCTPELNCGCMAKSPQDELRKRIARALDETVDMPLSSRLACADAAIAALGLREVHDGEGHYWQTPWERIEVDG